MEPGSRCLFFPRGLSENVSSHHLLARASSSCSQEQCSQEQCLQRQCLQRQSRQMPCSEEECCKGNAELHHLEAECAASPVQGSCACNRRQRHHRGANMIPCRSSCVLLPAYILESRTSHTVFRHHIFMTPRYKLCNESFDKCLFGHNPVVSPHIR